MFFKRLITIGVLVSSLALVVIALTGNFSKISHLNPLVETGPQSPLTGLPAEIGRVLVVKIDDTTPAHPQVGLKDADVVYIEQVEGGLTRLAAVFSSKIPPLIGPVRSARITDVELFAQYGKIGFAYSGAQKKLLPVIAAANMFDVGANRFGAEFYANDPLRNPPYAMMLKAPQILVEAQSRGMTFERAKNMGWKFGDASPLANETDQVEINWPAARYVANWSESESRWLLSHNGLKNLDDSGYHLGPENLIVQIVSITDSIYRDKVGGVTPFSQTVGTGDCYLFRNGTSIPCRWSRTSAEAGTLFTDINGEEIYFTPGRVWIALTGKAPVISAPSPQDATRTMSK